MNLFDKVQESSQQLAGIIITTLGVALLISGCWALHETLDSETRAYFVIGYMSGEKRFPAKLLLDELNDALGPYIMVLKGAFSVIILVGIMQIIGGLLVFKFGKTRQFLISWIISSIIAIILSLLSAIVPLAIGFRGFIELQVNATVAGVNAFILIHVTIVSIIELRQQNQNSGSGSSRNSSTTSSRGTTSTIIEEGPPSTILRSPAGTAPTVS